MPISGWGLRSHSRKLRARKTRKDKYNIKENERARLHSTGLTRGATEGFYKYIEAHTGVDYRDEWRFIFYDGLSSKNKLHDMTRHEHAINRTIERALERKFKHDQY